MEENYSIQNKTRRSFVFVLLLLFLGGIVFFVSKDQTVQFTNKAAEAIALDKTQASQVILLRYAEEGPSNERTKMRVEVPHNFAFTPESIVSGASDTKETPQIVTPTKNDYECHDDMSDTNDPMMSYETQLYPSSVTNNLDEQFYITFTDQNGKKYATTISPAHVCTVLAKDAVQQVSPPASIDVPKE